MIASMTGYGRAQRTCTQGEITLELRAVNHRYFDCTVRVPRLFTYLEEVIKSRVQSAMNRGKVDVFLTLELAPSENIQISLNRPLLEGYLEATRMMEADFGLRNDLTVSIMSRFPDIFNIKKEEIDTETLTAEVCAAVDEALSIFSEMRAHEGERLVTDILDSLTAIERIVAAVELRSPVTVEEYRARLDARMKEVLEGVGVDENRILAEAALYADRVAVNEETVRLRSHISQVRALLKQGGTVGRKLDFLVQECNREANTIGSKGHDTAIAMLVVDLKAEIEKIREQAQNIE